MPEIGTQAQPSEYYARSDPNGMGPTTPGAQWQLLRDHLRAVSTNARNLMAAARPNHESLIDAAGSGGLLHDLGKYGNRFQQRLLGDPVRVEHSGHGAARALGFGAVDVALAIAGHHAGLPALVGTASSLRARVERCARETETLWELVERDFESHGLDRPAGAPPSVPSGMPAARLDLQARMLASVLVDADRLDAGRQDSSPYTLSDAQTRLQRLLAYIEKRAARTPQGAVRAARRAVLDACLSAAEWPQRLLSLTVPTGGGKTLASMAFALRRIALLPNRYRRVLVVVPYLTIIEQNASVLAEAVGADAILEHHSGELRHERDDESGLHGAGAESATENWNVPIVVTTSVRFFESLFSNRPADLRRLHNIARSIVVLDEVQVLPRHLLRALLSMMRGLADDWGTTFLFCTATQPALERPTGAQPSDPRWEPGSVSEVIPQPKQLFSVLERVRVSWPGCDGRPARLSWSDLAKLIAQEHRALCIVNLRRHAAELYQALVALDGVESARVWHLSTRMCAEHRLDVLGKVRQQLAEEANRPCHVVATQLVEAGVDLDFPAVFRAMGPFDAIAQAAGRCDREGHATEAAGAPAGTRRRLRARSGRRGDGNSAGRVR